MSVIGRLDEQVNAVLITPLKRQQTPDEERREQPTIPAPSREERDAESTGQKRADDSPLPVWLL